MVKEKNTTGKKWYGFGYNTKSKLVYGIKNGEGLIEEYYSSGAIKFEGKYLKGKWRKKWKRF